MNQIFKILFYIGISFITLTIFTLTFGQIIPIEIKDSENLSLFYSTLLFGFPVAICLTLFKTIKKANTKNKNWLNFILTIITAFISFFILVFIFLTSYFGEWKTVTIIYQNKNENIEISEQWYDVGAFGYGGKRIVKTESILKFWKLTTNIDTSTINKEEWKLVNLQGEIKMP